MKRIYASLGVAAIGVAAIHSVQGQSTDPSRAWSVSASLRGFYDDNVNNGSGNDRLDSFGAEVSPSLSFALPLEQTSISGSYAYTYRWYEKAVNGKTDHDDQTHTLAAQLRHTFSERLLMSVQDSFVIGQEADVLRIGNGAVPNQRIPGENIRNYGSIVLNAQVTRIFGVEVGYGNTLFDYADNTFYDNAGNKNVVGVDGSGYPLPNGVSPSRSGLLDRMEHTAHVDGRWQLQRDTVGIVGYQFSVVNYMENQPIGVIATNPTNNVDNVVVYSRDRDSRSHYGYVGLEHTFRPDLTGNIRGGIRYIDNYNSPGKENSVSPFFRGGLHWTYAQESSVDVGVSHDRSATDQFSTKGNSITQDSDTTGAYASLNHRIAPNLFGSVIGNFQYSSYNGGARDQDSERYYGVGVDLEYRFNRHVSANVGYNYDKRAISGGETNLDYDRNRVYLGATFVY